MAITAVTPVVLTGYNVFVKESASTDLVALDATLGASFTMSARDEKYVICVTNVHSTDNVTAIIQAGDHIQSDFGTLSYTLAAGDVAWFVLDSGRFKNISGTYKGKVVIKAVAADGSTGTADLQIKVIQLP